MSNPTIILIARLASAAIARVVIPVIIVLLQGSSLSNASYITYYIKKALVVLNFLNKGYN